MNRDDAANGPARVEAMCADQLPAQPTRPIPGALPIRSAQPVPDPPLTLRSYPIQPTWPIETPRLVLRPFVEDDLAAFHSYSRLNEVAQYLYWDPRDEVASRAALELNMTRTGLREDGDGLVLAIVWREIGQVVGHSSLALNSAIHRQGEVGFIVHPDHQGRGLATEAAQVMLRLGFENYHLHRIMARCDARNLASAGVMKRLGMRQEAHFIHNEIFKGEWGDEFIYALLEDEWRARQ